MKAKLLIFLLSLTCLVGQSQSLGSIKGRVLSGDDGNPLIGAHVYVNFGGSVIGAISDTSGYFVLKPLTPGTYNIKYSYIGFKEHTMSGVIVNPDKITFVDEMKMMIDELVVVDVVYHKGLIDPESPSRITLNSNDLDKMINSEDLNQLITTMTPEAIPTANGNLSIRGSRSDASSYIIDGMKVRDGQSGLANLAVGSVTVYTGGVPAQYGDVTGGVIVIETKNYFTLLNQYLAWND